MNEVLRPLNRILDWLNSLFVTRVKRELNEDDSESAIDFDKEEYLIYNDSNVSMTKSIFIILVIGAIGVFAQNSSEELSTVLGFSLPVWQIGIIAALILAAGPIYKSLTYDSPVIIISNTGLKLKGLGLFAWNEISELLAEKEYSNENATGDNGYNLVFKYHGHWYRANMDELTSTKEEIEIRAGHFWKKNRTKNKSPIIYK